MQPHLNMQFQLQEQPAPLSGKWKISRKKIYEWTYTLHIQKGVYVCVCARVCFCGILAYTVQYALTLLDQGELKLKCEHFC